VGFYFRFLFLGLVLSFSEFDARAVSTPSFLGSFESRARAYTGLTSPLLPTISEPARRNLAEQSFLSDNVALLAWLPGHQPRFYPADLRAQKSGALFNPGIGDLAGGPINASELAEALEATPNSLQSVQTQAGAMLLRKEVGFSLFYEDTREAMVDSDGGLSFSRYRDFKSQLGVGTPLFIRKDIGRLDFGVLVKFIARRGDEIYLRSDEISAINSSLLDADLKKSVLAGGADLGWLYTMPVSPGGFKIQTAFTWRDLGTTQFFLGHKSSQRKRFRRFSNSQNVGIGLGSPLLLDSFRWAVRVEGLDLSENIPVADKMAISSEFRFAEAFSIYTGFRGPSPTFGAQFRLPFIELLVSSFPLYTGNGSATLKHRQLALSMKAAL
jgi:hypothetical protein